jgi:hypothetical protein
MSDTRPQIGDSKPAPEPDTGKPPGVDGFTELRAAYDRSQRRNAELESIAVENRELRRLLGLARAGVSPDSTFGQVVVDAAAANDLSDPDDVADLARALRVELMSGGNGHQED